MLKEKMGHTLEAVSAVIIITIIFTQFSYSSGAQAIASNTTFNVNVKEYLSMSITEPTTWASANVDTFMCNTIGLKAITNNTSGLVVGMTSSTTNTSLTNSAASSNNTIPTLASSNSYSTGSFPSNYWGYYSSATSTETCGTSTYYGIPASSSTPGNVLSGTAAGTYTGNVHFGAKASSTKASGTYTGTVIFSAISGQNTINSNPTNPATPASPEQTATTTTTTGGAPSGTTTVYSYTTTAGSPSRTTTTTQLSDGNNTSSYNGYTGYNMPQGVTEIDNPIVATDIGSGTPLATGLAVAATAAATSGIIFFILAKRKKDDDEEESEKES